MSSLRRFLYGLKVVEPNICLFAVGEGVVGLPIAVLVLDEPSEACLAHTVLEQFLALVRR